MEQHESAEAPTIRDTARPRRIGRSIGAVLGGIVAGIILTIGTDIALQATGVFPPLGRPMGDALLLLATAHRTVYSVAAGYIVARLAPDRPMSHALAGGVVGFVACTVGAVVTWDSGLGPHWYPLALVALAMPCAWAGGRLRLIQLRARVDSAGVIP